jgi:DME family drug/metabolite transporter
MAYEGGTNALSVSSVRSTGVVVLTLAVCVLTGRRIQIAGGRALDILGLGLLLAIMFYANIAAVQFIDVSLAALLFFIYPPLVVVLVMCTSRGPFPMVKLTSAMVAFGGLAVALGVSVGVVDPRGVVLGLSAGVACAVNAVWIGRRMQDVDPLVLTFLMSVVATAVILLVTWSTDAFVLPQTASGWTGAIGVVTLQCCCVPMYFAAIRYAGPEMATMLTNVQPITSIFAAYLLYSEAMTGLQYTGAVMVLMGIWIMQWQDMRNRARR